MKDNSRIIKKQVKEYFKIKIIKLYIKGNGKMTSKYSNFKEFKLRIEGFYIGNIIYCLKIYVYFYNKNNEKMKNMIFKNILFG